MSSPSTEGSMPKWVPKAIVFFFIAQLVYQFTLSAILSLRGFVLTILVSLFLSFAIEPAVNSLEKRGMRRGPATGLVFLILIVVTGIFIFAIASLVVDQLANLSSDTPRYLDSVQGFINRNFHTNINTDDLRNQFSNSESPIRKAIDKMAGNVVDIGTSAVGIIFQLLTIALFTFYFVADAPKLRRSLLRRLPPERQALVLNTWELAIEKTGGYIYSRALLALLSGFAHWMILEIMGVPYAVALGVWVGVISQFIPVVGTYIAGVLPIAIALLQDTKTALIIFAFIVIYQQVENYLLAPRITSKTMDMHPAVAFASVIIGGSVFGPVGALLSLPAAAMIQAFASLYLAEHAIIDSPMTAEPTSKRKKN